jgi:4-hydroxy-tetrahydrodipicolinate synthase
MKYRKTEAKEYARAALKGVWTALPTNFTDDDQIDAAGMAFNLERCITDLAIEGHYCHGNVAEFWSLTNEERKRIHEINVTVARGRVPIIAGCHHQNPYEVVELCRHAWDSGVDFAIILTPYVASNSDDAVFDFYEFVAERVDIGIILFNIPTTYHPISDGLARRLARIPNVCGFKQGGPAPAAAINLRATVGRDVVVSVADETPWLHNAAVAGDEWLLNYCPHLYQVPGHLPVRDYTRAIRAGDMGEAVTISRTVNPSRAVHAKWITGYARPHGRVPAHEQKLWMEALGMVGGPVRLPCAPMSDDARAGLLADLEATGLPAKARAAAAGTSTAAAG